MGWEEEGEEAAQGSCQGSIHCNRFLEHQNTFCICMGMLTSLYDMYTLTHGEGNCTGWSFSMYHFQVVAIVSFQGAAAQNELETQALELLVNFAHKMEQEGLMPNLSEEVSGVPSNGSGAQPTVEGSKAKQAGAPPLQASMLSSPSIGSSCSLAQSGTPVMAPPPSQSLPRSLQQGSLRHELPGPVPECLQSTKGAAEAFFHFQWVYLCPRCTMDSHYSVLFHWEFWILCQLCMLRKSL